MSNTISNNGNNSQFPNLSDTAAAGAAGAGRSASSKDSNSWFEAMAKAWGSALDKQAQKITDLSSTLTSQGGAGTDGGGGAQSDSPSTLTMLTTESLKMNFLSTSASTSENAVGQSLESLGRKQ